MQIQIRSNALEIRRWLDDAQKKQIPFATVMAMTQTAKDVSWEEIGVMQRVFDRPTPYTLNALQVKPATKSNMIASVEFRDGGNGTPAKRFLNPEVYGGARSQKSHELQIAPLLKGYSYLVPARSVPRDQYGNITRAVLRKVISQLRVSTDSHQNASSSKRSKAKRKSEAFFVNPRGNMVMQRKGKIAAPFLVGVKSPNYRKRFPFHETGEAVVRDRFAANFEAAFQRAMATSGFNSPKSAPYSIGAGYDAWRSSSAKRNLFG